MSNTQISFESGIYAVAKLAAFKGIEIKDNEYLVRKIEKGTGKDSLGCIVPAVQAQDFVAALENQTVFNTMISQYQNLWNDFLKEKLEDGKNLYKTDMNLSELVAWIEAQEVKEGRISKEKIAAWFDNEVAKVLHRAFYEKLGASIDNDKMNAILKSYKDQFMNLAKREITFAPAVRVNLEKAISLLQPSVMKTYCENKLNAAEEKQADMMAL